MPASPFTDPALVRGRLYATATRLGRRGDALYAAKVAGVDAGAAIADLVDTVAPAARTVLDVGGGGGEIARHLACRLPRAHVVVLDQSTALLGAARGRLSASENASAGIGGDFHHLPVRPGRADVIVAAFCLYHSPEPRDALAEIARCLAPGGAAVVATKSADSYRELDELVARSGLDPDAERRPSLYGTFHGANAATVVATSLRVEHEWHHDHVFRFDDHDHLATYLATSPKYRLPAALVADAALLAAELRRRVPERSLTATSTVTYVAGTAS